MCYTGTCPYEKWSHRRNDCFCTLKRGMKCYLEIAEEHKDLELIKDENEEK